MDVSAAKHEGATLVGLRRCESCLIVGLRNLVNDLIIVNKLWASVIITCGRRHFTVSGDPLGTGALQRMIIRIERWLDDLWFFVLSVE